MRRKKPSATRRPFGARVVLLVGLVIALLAAIGYARAYYQDYKIKQEIKALEAEVSKLETKKLESIQLLEYVMSDAYVEEKARTELNMKKPGENVLIVTAEGSGTEQRVVSTVDEEQGLSNPQKWWYYFTTPKE